MLAGAALLGCPASGVEDCERKPNPELTSRPIELSGAALGFTANDELAVLVTTDAGRAVEVPSKQWLLPVTQAQQLIGYWAAAKGVVLGDSTRLFLVTPEESKQILDLPDGVAGITLSPAGLYVVQGNNVDPRVSIHLILPDLQVSVLERGVDLNPKTVFASGTGYCVQEYVRDGGPTGTNQIRCNSRTIIQGPDNANQYYGVRATNRHIAHYDEAGHIALRIVDGTRVSIDVPPEQSRFVAQNDSCGFLFAERDGGSTRLRYWSSQSESLVLDHQLQNVPTNAVSAESKDGIYLRSGPQILFLNAWSTSK